MGLVQENFSILLLNLSISKKICGLFISVLSWTVQLDINCQFQLDECLLFMRSYTFMIFIYFHN